MQQIEVKIEPIAKGIPITQPTMTSAHPELSDWLSLVAENQDKAAFTKLFVFFHLKFNALALNNSVTRAKLMN